MELIPLTLKSKDLFKEYSLRSERVLSAYAFGNILIWKPLFEISYSVKNDSLCIFFKDAMGCFMILPPLGRTDKKTIEECFNTMRGFNGDSEVSRIENIEESQVDLYKKNGFRIFEKSVDYIVSSEEMSALRGDKFKHKRNLSNHFAGANEFMIRPYKNQDKQGVIELYGRWMKGRGEKNNEPVYTAMLEDSRKALLEELENFFEIDFSGYVIEIGGKVAAFSSGIPVSEKTFCINFEITDLAFKGISQYIFNFFSKEISRSYPLINIMDDSGIENIRQTKLSYKPLKSAVSYTALMK